MNKKISTKGKFPRKYRADFLVSYQADGVQYTRWVSANGLDRGFSRHVAAQDQALTLFNDGKSYPCWYNPENPEMIMLVQREFWSYFSPVILPALAGIVAGILFIKNIWLTIRLKKRSMIRI
jgi:hypothetical protein